MDSWIRCEYTKITHEVATAARTRETPNFLGRPASQTSEMQDGSRQPATNFKILDWKPFNVNESLGYHPIKHGSDFLNLMLEIAG